MRKTFLLIVAALAVTAVVGATAGARPTATPGVTAKSILLEGTYPLSGPASGYAPIPVGMGAYFSYVNAQGGVNGRKINWHYEDDGYNPANTVQITHKFVEQDHAFALVGGLGTEPQLAVRQYLNDNKVPQLFVSTGATTFDRDFAQYPWTIGWQPDYPGEAKVYGKYIAANMPNAKIGVLYQNDAYGKNYYAGLRVGLGEAKVKIVDAESYDATNPSVTQQILALKSKGADTFVVFATPTPTITALATATKVGWDPAATFINNVSANRLFLLAAAASGAKVDGIISTNYLASSTTQPNLPGVKLAGALINQYAPALQQSFARGDANIIYGFGVAWTFVYALQHAGKNLTRAGLMNALHNLNTSKNPFVYPGISLQTSAKDNFPIEQEILIKWSGATGDFKPFGKLLGKIR
jgi:branched-chain amino acid transport system substrate-binding protein